MMITQCKSSTLNLNDMRGKKIFKKVKEASDVKPIWLHFGKETSDMNRPSLHNVGHHVTELVKLQRARVSDATCQNGAMIRRR